MIQVFFEFFKLGWISFGGPAAHIGYFQKRFVEELKWVESDQYGHYVALSHFLPGPGSSQVGFAVGCHQAGLAGGIGAFIGFTLPSFLLMALLAIFGFQFLSEDYMAGTLLGLKFLAVWVVATAIKAMYQNFCTTISGQLFAALSALILIWLPILSVQLGLIIIAAVLGQWMFSSSSQEVKQKDTPNRIFSSNPKTMLALLIFTALLLALPFFSNQTLQVANLFYQAGSWVFGGGHVVLPLLQSQLGSSITQEQFITGYSLAQAVPGPMFTMASFLGPFALSDSPWLGAVIATIMVFLPGLLLMYGLVQQWQALMENRFMSRAAKGINCAVVGLLAAAWVNPIILSAVSNLWFAIPIIAGFLLVNYFKLSIFKQIIVAIILGNMSALIL